MTRYEEKDDCIFDTKTGLEWQKTTTKPMTWHQAVKYAEGLGDGWRLPTVDELESLVDRTMFDPASTYPGMPSEALWSSLSYAEYTGYAWAVYFYGGYVYIDGKDASNYVRCVREKGGTR